MIDARSGIDVDDVQLRIVDDVEIPIVALNEIALVDIIARIVNVFDRIDHRQIAIVAFLSEEIGGLLSRDPFHADVVGLFFRKKNGGAQNPREDYAEP